MSELWLAKNFSILPSWSPPSGVGLPLNPTMGQRLLSPNQDAYGPVVMGKVGWVLLTALEE